MMKSLSILFLGTQMAVGGAQRVLLEQARWFHEAGYAVTTAFFYDKENLQARWQAQNPFPVVNLRADWNTGNLAVRVGRLLIALVRLWRLLRSRRVDIIETFTPHSNVLGIPVAWLASVPVRVPTHHTKIEGASRWLERIHGWLINSRLTTRMVAVSTQVRDLAVRDEGVRPERIEVIPNGIRLPEPVTSPSLMRRQLEREYDIEADALLIFTAGRLVTQKGHTYLLAAIPRVLARYPTARFAIAGDGHLREALASQVDQLGIGRAVKFLGIRADIPDLLAAADIFVLPSLWEGLPLALLEAMGAGKPVVATRVEGVSDVLRDGENGLLVPPGDADALADALSLLLSDRGLRHVFGARARALIEREYTIAGMCERYKALFLQEIA